MPLAFTDLGSSGCYPAVCFVSRHEIHVTSQVIGVDKTEYPIGSFCDVWLWTANCSAVFISTRRQALCAFDINKCRSVS